MKSTMLMWAVAATAVSAAIGPSLLPSTPWLVYNPSRSVPRGWYVVHVRDDYKPGDIVLARLPAAAAALAAQRGYLPSTVPLLKRVGAIAPQAVCIQGGLVRVDSAPVAAARTTDAHGRPLPVQRFCQRLDAQQVLLLSTDSTDSFDGRYFGPLDRQQIIGVARLVWTS